MRGIQTLVTDDVLAAVRAAVRGGLDAEEIADFLAEVDWSNPESASIGIRSLLAELEGWSTAYAEGDIDAEQYRNRLLGVASGLAAVE